MSPRVLKAALGVSVALNVFALAVGATVLVRKDQAEARVEALRRPAERDGPPILVVVESLDPAVRDRVRARLRTSALEARPDFEEARGKRREAVALARSPEFDSAQVRLLLEESRMAELRGRARLESGAVGVLESVTPADRSALAAILARRGRSDVHRREARPEEETSAPAA